MAQKIDVVKNLQHIIKTAREYEIDGQSQIDGYNYLIKDVEKLLEEIKNVRSN